MLIKFCFPSEIKRDDVSSNAVNEFSDFNIENHFEMMEMDTENVDNSENVKNSGIALRNAPGNAPIAEGESEIDSE